MMYLIAHESIHGEPFPEPLVVATLTDHSVLTKNMSVRKALEAIAGRLGVTKYEIVHGDPTHAPGFQLSLNLKYGGEKL